MNLETAPRADEGEDSECAVCGAQNSFVLYDNDKVCRECQHVRGEATNSSESLTVWEQWWQHRETTYSGFRGSERIKMVGGFAAAYDD
ncbi:hypothetical protein HAPG_00029 [Halorubrum phage GNf2]|nr:hypothetical protein HAPG_00029 [Halorubrum phage GNf2]